MKRLLLAAIIKDPLNSKYQARFLDYPDEYVSEMDSNVLIEKAEKLLTSLFNESAVEEPKTHEDAMAYIAELKDAGLDAYPMAFLMNRLRDYKVVRINISMPDTDLEVIDKHAHSKGLTRSAFLCESAMLRVKAEDPSLIGELTLR